MDKIVIEHLNLKYQDGTESLRDRRESGRGLARAGGEPCAAVLREVAGDWIAGGERHVLLCGAVCTTSGSV